MIPIVASRASWVVAAVADLPTLLVDHAHCERKAANTALRFMSKFPDADSTRLSKLAREELVHYEQVLRELARRGITFGALASASYAARLFDAVRPSGIDRRVDELLCCALIEARSHERFVRLIDALPVEESILRTLYDQLLEAEARHGDLYFELAARLAPPSLIDDRLAALSAHEDAVVHRFDQPLRMHAGG